MSTIHRGKPTTILAAQKCWRMKKAGGELEQRGGKGLILIKFYPFRQDCSNSQPFIQADQGCMEILRTSIASKAVKHESSKATVVINCQDWSHRESMQNPIKRFFYIRFKTNVRADFFIEIWNELFNEYYTHKKDSIIGGLDNITIAKKSVQDDEAATTTSADKSLEIVEEDSFDVYPGNYSDEDELFEQTQPTTEPLTFDLKRM